MKRIFMSILAVLFPWIILLLYGNIIGALIAVVLQVTVIGWPFAIFWAFRTMGAISRTRKKPLK